MRLSLLLLLFATSLGAAEPAVPEPAPLRVPAFAFPAPTWEGPQFLANDKKGQVFLLKPAALQVFPANARSPEPEQLEFLPKVGAAGFVRSAAMNLSGDRWALLEGSRARLFVGGREVEVERLAWNPQAVTFQGDDLVVAVLPQRIEPEPRERTSPPLLLSWDGRRWNTLADDSSLSEDEEQSPMTLKQNRAAWAWADSQRRVWVANLHRYRLRQLSPGGRVLTEITVDGGKVREVGAEEVAARLKTMQAELEAQGVPAEEVAKGQFVVNRAKSVLVALAEGPDGRLYVLAHDEKDPETGGDLVLDRYDPGAQTYERARLALDQSGLLSMVAGKDGLVLAAFDAREPARWLLGWQDLDEADWRPVRHVEIGGGS